MPPMLALPEGKEGEEKDANENTFIFPFFAIG